jgi:hypothetical protein
MPLYRFHVLNDIDAPDEEGQEFSNLAAAHLQAIDYVRAGWTSVTGSMSKTRLVKFLSPLRSARLSTYPSEAGWPNAVTFTVASRSRRSASKTYDTPPI